MEDFKLKFIANFITDNRWKYFTNGLGTTYVVSFFAVILGVVIGVLIAVVRSSADKLDRPPLVVKILNVICKLYLTVIRGTPAMIQLLIMYYIVFGSVDVSKRLGCDSDLRNQLRRIRSGDHSFRYHVRGSGAV